MNTSNTLKTATLLTPLFPDSFAFHAKAGKVVGIIKEYDNGYTLITYVCFEVSTKQYTHTCKIKSEKLQIKNY